MSVRILIVGAGGLGIPAVLALATAGAEGGVTLGGVTLMDPDPVELSNLPRQVLYDERDIGELKVVAAARHLSQLYPALTLSTLDFRLDSDNARTIIGDHSFVIDGTDNPTTKFLINDFCVALGRPFVYAGVLGLTGQAMTVIPGETACLRCLFEEPPDEAEIASCREAGIIGPVAGAIGEIEAAEALAWCGGRMPALAGMMLTLDGTNSRRIRLAAIAARAGCRCGAARAARKGGMVRSSTAEDERSSR